MMDDPHVNYYEAVKAYNEYWKHHEKPNDKEEEMMSQGNTDKLMKEEKEKELEQQKDNSQKHFSEKQLKEISMKEQMAYQVKRFEGWMNEVKPFVQEDGRILSQQEITDIWKKQQQEKSKEKIKNTQK